MSLTCRANIYLTILFNTNCYEKQGCGSGSGRILSRMIFTGSESGSGSYRYFGYVRLYKQGKNISKIERLHIFRWIFPFFQIKIIIIQISEEIWLMWKKCRCLNGFLVSASRIRIRFIKFWFAGSGSGRKWTGSATLMKRQNFRRFFTLTLINVRILHCRNYTEHSRQVCGTTYYLEYGRRSGLWAFGAKTTSGIGTTLRGTYLPTYLGTVPPPEADSFLRFWLEVFVQQIFLVRKCKTRKRET